MRQAQATDAEAWDRYTQTARSASLCHLYGWRSVIEQAYAKRCFYLFVCDEQNRWQGILPLVLMKGPLASVRLVSLPFLDQGGIVSETTPAAELLLAEAIRLAASLGASGIDLRGSSLSLGKGALPGERFRFLLDIGGSEEDLWGLIGGKVRNQVRKATKKGLVTERTSPEKLNDFYGVFCQNMRDLGSPVHSRSFFLEIFEAFGERARLFITYDGEQRPVAGGIAISFQETVSVPWASSLRTVRSSCPNHSLYWKILRGALDQGATVFDFGRSSQGTGTYHFKKQWGATPVPLEWTSSALDGTPMPSQLASANRYPLVAKLWSRLPLRVANLLGPAIRGRLPN